MSFYSLSHWTNVYWAPALCQVLDEALWVQQWTKQKFLALRSGRQTMWKTNMWICEIVADGKCIYFLLLRRRIESEKKRKWKTWDGCTFNWGCLEKEMATHSSVPAWRIPGAAEPGGLPSMGSHRVRHDWSDLASAAAAYLVSIVFVFQVSWIFLDSSLAAF